MTGAAAPFHTEPRRIDEAVARVREGARVWARAPIGERIALARSMLRGAIRVAERSVRAACEAKGMAFGSAAAGDEWLASAYLTVRFLRQWVVSLEAIARTGNTPLGRIGQAFDGRTVATVFPASRLDAFLFPGVRGEAHFREGVGATGVHERRARFYKRPHHDGIVCGVLGAGNVNSIPPADVGTKLFNEGKVCVLKMNPVNAYMGPIIEDAFADAVSRGFLAVVYGGAEEGGYLVSHPGVDEVHITGATATHDLIVWGPPGPERAARIARGEPVLRKPITSELGDIAPVLVVPGPWDERSLAFQAQSVAGMVTQNGSFNCLAARTLVLPAGWKARDEFLALVERFMFATPARNAWYPGASDRYRRLTEGRRGIRRSEAGPGALPWTLLTGLDTDRDRDVFRTEAFCPVLGETSVGSDDPIEYLEAAIDFVTRRLWGTLSANVVVPPKLLSDPTFRSALDGAIRRLKYGSVAVNCSAGYAFGLGTPPWGSFPGQPLANVQSGIGFVHNTLMLEDVEKTVIWHPAVHRIKPTYFPTHRTVSRLSRRLISVEGRRNWLALPGVLAAAVRA
jgi:aldehyde dehydrogenase (NAD(P)+)